MEVRLSKWGNSLAMRLPKSLAQSLRLEAGQAIELVVEEGAIRLRPVAAPMNFRLEDLVAEAERIGLERAPALEDWSAVETKWPEYEGERDGGPSKARRSRRR